MKILLSILIIAFTFSVNAQETGSKQKGTLSFNWGKWRLDGKRIQLREVKNEILKVEKANFYFKRSRANLTTAYLATIPTVAFILLGKQNQNPASPNFGKSRAGFSIAGFLSAGFMIFEMAQFSKNSKKAAKIYNTY